MKHGLKIYFIVLSVVIFMLDRIMKYVVIESIDLWESVEVIKNIFHITLVYNKGAAFGLFKDQAAFFIIVSLLAAITIIYYATACKNFSTLKATSLALILGGTLGNLVDRVRFGYVIDFLDFRIWPVFNFADSAITIGAFILLCELLFNKNKVKDVSGTP